MSTTDHYDVLGVAATADDREIKRAFYRLLKENPPEQKPKEYQRLREAYDVLSDPVARREYDSMAQFGAEIDALRKRAEDVLGEDEPDYDEAERLLKKAIVLGPNIGLLRQLLGQCYLDAERPADALRQFERATTINPDNAGYQLGYGRALKASGRTTEAERVIRSAWARDPEDYAAPRALAALLYEEGRKQEAHHVLDEAIGADGKVDFQDFFCLYDKLHFHLFDGENDELRRLLNEVSTLAKNEADRRFASFLLFRTGGHLHDVRAYKVSAEFFEAAHRLEPSEELQEVVETERRSAAIDEAFHSVIEQAERKGMNDVVLELAKIHAGSYFDFVDEDDFSRRMREACETADALYEEGRKQEAHHVLDEAIGADGKVDFQDFFCLYDKLHFHLFDGENDELRRLLNEVSTLAKNEADRRFASFLLFRTGGHLHDVRAYKVSAEFFEAAHRLEPSEELQEVVETERRSAAIDEAFHSVIEQAERKGMNDVVLELAKIHAGSYFDFVDEDDFSRRMREACETADALSDKDPFASAMRSDAKALRDQHRPIYDLHPEIFDVLIGLPPAPLYAGECPHCRRPVLAQKAEARAGGPCPRCHRPIRLGAKGFVRTDTPKPAAPPVSAPTPTSDSSGCVWVPAAIALGTLAAALAGCF